MLYQHFSRVMIHDCYVSEVSEASEVWVSRHKQSEDARDTWHVSVMCDVTQLAATQGQALPHAARVAQNLFLVPCFYCIQSVSLYSGKTDHTILTLAQSQSLALIGQGHATAYSHWLTWAVPWPRVVSILGLISYFLRCCCCARQLKSARVPAAGAGVGRGLVQTRHGFQGLAWSEELLWLGKISAETRYDCEATSVMIPLWKLASIHHYNLYYKESHTADHSIATWFEIVFIDLLPFERMSQLECLFVW